MGQPGVTGSALLLELLDQGELGTPVLQIVDLQQFHLVGLQQLQRALELRQSGFATGGTDLGGQKSSGTQAELGQQIADHRLCAAVAGGSIDESGARGEEAPQYFLQW